jgi:hypothetical protein
VTRPLLIIFALVLILVGASAALGDPPAVAAGTPSPAALAPTESPDVRWEGKLDEARLRVRKAEARHVRALSAWKHARHRQKPRGDALVAIESDLHKAADELFFAKEDLPRLLELARRDGVQPGVLRRYE